MRSRDVLDGGAHGVGGVHGADDDRPLKPPAFPPLPAPPPLIPPPSPSLLFPPLLPPLPLLLPTMRTSSLKRIFTGSTSLNCISSRETARIVVRLDAALALENVGPDGALREKLYAVKLARFLGEDLDELVADDLALLLGIGDPASLSRKRSVAST